MTYVFSDLNNQRSEIKQKKGLCNKNITSLFKTVATQKARNQTNMNISLIFLAPHVHMYSVTWKKNVLSNQN